MSHDKFCALLEFSDVDHPNKLALCNCRFLATVRADEREKAAQRVGAFLFESPFTIDGLIEQAVAAARGEDTSHE